MNRLHRRESNRLSLKRGFQALAFAAIFSFLWMNFHFGLPPPSNTNFMHWQQRKLLRIAYVGNSLLFYNDCPGLLAAMIEASDSKIKVDYDACLKGGAAFSNFMDVGCAAKHQMSPGTLTLPKLLNQQWDYIILQDQSAAPTNIYRKSSIHALNVTFSGPIYKSGGRPIFLQTAGKRDDHFESMTRQLHQGYQSYVNKMNWEFYRREIAGQSSTTKMAQVSPVGEAYAQVYRQNPKLWKRLYISDGLHPTALGTWLQACVLFATITGTEPPRYDPAFWTAKAKATPTFGSSLTVQEAEELRAAAMQAVGMSPVGGKS